MPTDFFERLRQGVERKKPQLMKASIHTGVGSDGVAQPDKPIGMLNTAEGIRMVHEDEMVSQHPKTKMITVTPSPLTLAKSKEEQDEMVDIEQGKKFPGMMCGGKVKGYQYGTPVGGVAPASRGAHGFSSVGIGNPTDPISQQKSEMHKANADLAKKQAQGYVPAQQSDGQKAANLAKEQASLKQQGQSWTGQGQITTGVSPISTTPKTTTPTMLDPKKMAEATAKAGAKGTGEAVKDITTPETTTPSGDTVVTVKKSEHIPFKYESETPGFSPKKSLESFALGTHDAYNQAQQQTNNAVSATNRENMAFGLQGLAGAENLTTGGQNLASAQMISDSAGNTAKANAELGKAQAQQQYNATLALLGQGNLETNFWETKEHNDKMKKDANYKDVVNHGNELLQIMKEDTNEPLSYDEIIDEPRMVELLKNYFGRDYTRDEAKALIKTIATNMNSTNKGNYQDNTEALIDKSITTSNATKDEVLKDTNILNMAAKANGYMGGWDSLTPEQKDKVTKYITDIYGIQTQSPNEKVMDYLKTDLFKDNPAWDTPGFENTVNDWITDMIQTGKLTKNADGTWNLPENEALPFSNPDYIYGNSVDISGDDITYGTDGKKSLTVNGVLVPENQVYYSTDGAKGTTGGEGTYSAETVHKAWIGLSPAKKAMYYGVDGKLSQDELAKFIKDQVSNEGMGEEYSDGTYVATGQDKIASWYLDNTQGKSPNAQSVFKVDVKMGTQPQVNKTTAPAGVFYNGQYYDPDNLQEFLDKEFLGDNNFHYYDTTGVMHIVPKDSAEFKKIYFQMSEMNGGEALSVDDFNSYWGDGKMYPVDTDGNIAQYVETPKPFEDGYYDKQVVGKTAGNPVDINAMGGIGGKGDLAKNENFFNTMSVYKGKWVKTKDGKIVQLLNITYDPKSKLYYYEFRPSDGTPDWGTTKSSTLEGMFR